MKRNIGSLLQSSIWSIFAPVFCWIGNGPPWMRMLLVKKAFSYKTWEAWEVGLLILTCCIVSVLFTNFLRLLDCDVTDTLCDVSVTVWHDNKQLFIAHMFWHTQTPGLTVIGFIWDIRQPYVPKGNCPTLRTNIFWIDALPNAEFHLL